ncbi:MAG: hypothetical protein FOGNACKC_00820 [Anaerolineae bacterium]|nr:hypothetical protein [Anaerolineae bacterium]
MLTIDLKGRQRSIPFGAAVVGEAFHFVLVDDAELAERPKQAVKTYFDEVLKVRLTPQGQLLRRTADGKLLRWGGYAWLIVL